jgi:membrane-associated protease RseP (regulator of RpoE activity)
MNIRPFTLLALALPFASCSSSSMVSGVFDDGDATTLAERNEADGSRVVYRLRPSDDGEAPKLIRDRHTTVTKVRLPITVADINKDRAASLGVEAWKGVYVERVTDGSSLAKAGLNSGDVLLAINDVAFSNARQFNETAVDRLGSATQLALEILRADGQDNRTWSPLTLTTAADTREMRDTVRDTIELEYAPGVESQTGMQVTQLDADTSKEVLGIEQPTLVVSKVHPGSPAYLAGIRARDRIAKIDNQTADTVATINAVLTKRAQQSESKSLMVEVDGPLGSLTAPVSVVSHLHDESAFTVPIVWCYERDIDRLEWGFLQFIFQFGGSYERQYVDSASRAVAYSSSLSLLPLGLFELDEDTDEQEIEFLWFIHIRWPKD